MSYILALDQGTTSSRAILFDEDGIARAIAQRELTQHFPKSGWVEHDPFEIWESQLAVAREVLEEERIAADAISALGITNQRETTIVWDRATGNPICPAIVWQDRRTAEECNRLRTDGYAPLIQEKTGLVLDSYFSGTKLKWILDHIPRARERADAGDLAFGTVDSWLIWKLTGETRHTTDASNASRTLLYNIHTGGWDEELLELLDIPSSVLPEISPSSGICGNTGEGIFSSPVPIAGVAGDQQAALFGQLCLKPGMTKCTYGTGCFMLVNTGTEVKVSKNNLLSTVAWQIGNVRSFALEGSVFIGGAVVQWLRDGLGIIDNVAEIEALASSVADSGGLVLVPAFTGLGAPYWDPYARGILVGISRATTDGHVARAALEAIAFQVVDLVRAMRNDTGLAISELRVDGGATENDLLMQIQADLLGVPVVRPKVIETTSIGAAYLAGLAAGVWKNPEEIAGQWRVDRVFEPLIAESEREEKYTRWLDAVGRAKGWEQSSLPG